MRAYSMDLRTRVLDACDSGMGTSEVAEVFSVSIAWVKRLKQRRRETGEIGPREYRHGSKPIPEGHEDESAAIIQEKPDRTAKDIAGLLSVCVAHQTVDRVVRSMGYKVKKILDRRGTATARRGKQAYCLAALHRSI